MSHTYSRTSKLINEFGKCFSLADEVVIHKIFSSEREKNNKTITGRHLFDEVALNHEKVHYYHEIMDAISFLKKKLRKGDIFITMGAGDNWKVGRNLFEYFGGKQK